MSPEQMRKKAMAEEESLRHLRYAQANGMKHEMPSMYPDGKEKMMSDGGSIDVNAHGVELQ